MTGVLAFVQFESYKNAFMYNSKQTKPTVGIIALQDAKPCIYRESVCVLVFCSQTQTGTAGLRLKLYRGKLIHELQASAAIASPPG